MYTFTYKHGDRPLDGFTIERAAGRGGFGEVYFAVSDAGREVALKAVQGYEQIELRGIGQCMNLKSPHLVSIFDVKYNALGRPFVIMEYVAGPNLRQLLDEHPSGVGETKAAFFLREIAKGLTYLHDRGIVHRDLKPANIFYEDGYVKIGDYGLSKHITTSQHSGQTVTVGTVHYMAPEVGAGKYDRSIDIYAMGALLYELLTGVPPFVGASASEVLMKHLAAEPDLKGISEPFATTIKRAMAKDPAVRFQTIQEMVESVFGAEHVREGMSVFSPAELSVVAGRAANGIGGGARPASGGVAVASGSSTGLFGGPPPLPDRGRQLFGSRALAVDPSVDAARPAASFGAVADDPMHPVNRLTLGLGVMIVITIATAVIYAGTRARPYDVAAPYVLFGSLAALGGLWLVARWVFPRLSDRFWIQRRILAAFAMAVPALLPALPILDHTRGEEIWFAAFAPFLFLNVPRWTDPTRKVRISGKPLLGGVLMAWALANVAGCDALTPVGVVASITLAAQIFWPWRPVAPLPTDDSPPRPASRPVDPLAPVNPPASVLRTPSEAQFLPVPGWLRTTWLALAICSVASAAGFGAQATSRGLSRDDESTYAALCGVAAFTAVACLVKLATKHLWNWRSYLGRSVAIYALGASAIATWIYQGNYHAHGTFPPVAVFWGTLLTLAFVVLLFSPRRIGPPREMHLSNPEEV